MSQSNKPNRDDKRGSLKKLFDRFVLSWRLMADRRVSLFHKLIPPLAIFYLISPIDFIPEIIFGPFGYIDDIGIVIIALEFFIRLAPNEAVSEHLHELKNRVSHDSGYETGDVIEGEYTIDDQ